MENQQHDQKHFLSNPASPTTSAACARMPRILRYPPLERLALVRDRARRIREFGMNYRPLSGRSSRTTQRGRAGRWVQESCGIPKVDADTGQLSRYDLDFLDMWLQVE